MSNYLYKRIDSLVLPTAEPTKSIVGGPDSKPIHSLFDFMIDMYDVVGSQVTLDYDGYTNVVIGSSATLLFPSGTYEFDMTDKIPEVKNIEIGSYIYLRYQQNISYRFRVKLYFENGTNFIMEHSSGTFNTVSKLLTSKIERICIYVASMNRIILTNYVMDVSINNQKWFGLYSNQHISSGVDTSQLVDKDYMKLITVKDRTGALVTADEFFTDEELITLFNLMVKRYSRCWLGYPEAEPDEVWRRISQVNTPSLMRLASKLSKASYLFTADPTEEKSSRTTSSLLSTDATNSETNASNTKFAETPANATGDLVDSYTTNQAKSDGTNSGINASEAVGTGTDVLVTNRNIMDVVGLYYEQIGENILEEYITSFNGMFDNYDDE